MEGHLQQPDSHWVAGYQIPGTTSRPGTSDTLLVGEGSIGLQRLACEGLPVQLAAFLLLGAPRHCALCPTRCLAQGRSTVNMGQMTNDSGLGHGPFQNPGLKRFYHSELCFAEARPSDEALSHTPLETLLCHLLKGWIQVTTSLGREEERAVTPCAVYQTWI